MRLFRRDPEDPVAALRRLQARVRAVTAPLYGRDQVPAAGIRSLLEKIVDDVALPPKGGFPRAQIRLGETELLVYGQCDCGWRCACPEGSIWPHCPNCGELVLPPQVGPEDAALRSGYVAELMPEQDAVAAIRRLHGGP